MKKMATLASPVMIGLFLCTWAAATAAATLNGRVMNRTLGRAEKGVVVQLVHHSAQSAEVLVDTSDAEGRFSFELTGEPSADVPMMLSAEYKDVGYRSDRVTDLSETVEIAVYESTDRDDNIQMISHHLIVDAKARQVTQVLIYQNTGDRTYKTGAGHGHGIEVPLPEGVTDVQSDIPGVHTHGPTLVDSRPVPPGRMQLSFTTPLPRDGRLTQRFKYATPSIDVFITPAESEVSDVTMTDLGPVNLGERSFRRLIAENVQAGGQVSFRLGGSVVPVGASGPDVFDGDGKGPWALGGVALGALLALAYLKRGSRDMVEVSAGVDLGPEIRRTALIQQIADLDDRLEHGDIAADEHGKRRDALKAEVVDLTSVK
jgi:hypothetical protein